MYCVEVFSIPLNKTNIRTMGVGYFHAGLGRVMKCFKNKFSYFVWVDIIHRVAGGFISAVTHNQTKVCLIDCSMN